MGTVDIREDGVRTERLILLPVDRAIAALVRSSRDTLSEAIGVSIPGEWPEFPYAFSQEALAADTYPWQGYLFIDRREWSLVGNGGFKSAPSQTSEVEFGFEIARRFRNCGYATEAARRPVALAFDHGARSVFAHSLAKTSASTTVMRKAGMRFEVETENPVHGAVWRFRIDRPVRA